MTPTAKAIMGRLFMAALVLLAVFTATFVIMRAAPGGPFDRMDRLPPEVLENLEARYGLDLPLHRQYLRTLAGFLGGDFGPSLTFAPGRPVADVLAATVPVSAELGLYALLIACLLGGFFGALAGRRPGSWTDRITNLVSLLLISASVIVIATLVRGLFVREGSPFVLGGFGTWRNKLLPSLTLGLAYAAILQRLVRANVAAKAGSRLLDGAVARGVPARKAFLRYVLPEALVPMLSYMGPVVAGILTGSFVVESLFEVPGVAACFVQGAQARDYGLVAAAIMLYTTLLGLYLLFEAIHTLLDPRLRFVSPGREDA